MRPAADPGVALVDQAGRPEQGGEHLVVAVDVAHGHNALDAAPGGVAGRLDGQSGRRWRRRHHRGHHQHQHRRRPPEPRPFRLHPPIPSPDAAYHQSGPRRLWALGRPPGRIDRAPRFE